MTKHTPDFREQIAIHIEMLLDDEMRAHAYADKTHELEFQIFRVLGGYREALDAINVKDARISELEAELAAEKSSHLHTAMCFDKAWEKIEWLRSALKRQFWRAQGEQAKVERLRDVIADLIAGGESAEQADPRLGYIELQTDRETLARARETLAATDPKD